MTIDPSAGMTTERRVTVTGADDDGDTNAREDAQDQEVHEKRGPPVHVVRGDTSDQENLRTEESIHNDDGGGAPLGTAGTLVRALF